MNTQKTFSLFLTLVIVMTGPVAFADDDKGWKLWRGEQSEHTVPQVNNDLYRQECGGCHFAYQPGLLPKASWVKIMAGLDKHFGDNAELDPTDRTTLSAYLENNAADVVGSRFARWARGGAPLRITEMTKFRREHDELPRSALSNPKIKSLSNCNACHTKAETGSYDENQIKIPGIGRWDD